MSWVNSVLRQFLTNGPSSPLHWCVLFLAFLRVNLPFLFYLPTNRKGSWKRKRRGGAQMEGLGVSVLFFILQFCGAILLLSWVNSVLRQFLTNGPSSPLHWCVLNVSSLLLFSFTICNSRTPFLSNISRWKGNINLCHWFLPPVKELPTFPFLGSPT